MVENYSFSLCEFSEIVLLVALYKKEACLRSCETKAHAHAARRSFNIGNRQFYRNPCCISVMLCTSLGHASTSWSQALRKLFQIRDPQKVP